MTTKPATRSVETLAAPCWVLTEQGIIHHRTQADAAAHAPEYPGQPTPRRLDQPCVTVTCACCETVADEENDGVFHFIDEAEAEQVLTTAYGWTRDGDTWRCDVCTAGPCDPERGDHG